MVEVRFIDIGRKANQLTLDIQNKLLMSVKTETSKTLTSICSDLENNILAVGCEGTILKYDVTQDKFVLHPQSGVITTKDLFHIDNSLGDGVAVGDDFTVLYYNKSTDTFSPHTLNGYDTNIWLLQSWPVYTIYGVLIDIYIGKDKTNDHGVLYTYDGTTVTKALDTSRGTLRCLYTTNFKDYVVVGHGGGIYKSTDYGNTWTEVDTRITDENFITVHGLSYDELWIGTSAGKIYKYNFYTDRLKLVASGYPQINCINGNAKNDLYAVGNIGLFLHYDGKKWEQLPSGTVIGFSYMLILEENKIYIVGANGAVYRFYGKAYPSLFIDNVGETIGTAAKPLHVRTTATTMSTSVYTVTAASGGTQIVSQNTNRKSLLVQNIGSGDIYLKETALQSGEGIKVVPDGSYTTNTYVGDLWAYAVISGDKVVVNEEV